MLRRWTAEEIDRDGASSSATSVRSLHKKRIHPQRSFDALAVKLQQHASNPHLPAALHMSPSSTSVNTIHSIHPATSSGASVHRRLSVPAHVKDSLSTRRPSLPSVFEKAAHPSSTLKQALGIKGRRGSETSSLRKSSSKTSLASTMWSRDRSNSLVAEDEEAIGEEDPELGEEDGKEVPDRRRSEEFHRPVRSDSIGSLSIAEQPSTAPPVKTSFHPSEYAPPPTASRPPPFHTNSSSASLAHTFYRPRQSSQLSGRPSLSSQNTGPPMSPRVFVDDDEDGTAEEQGPNRPLATSPHSASYRSPLTNANAHRRESTASTYSIGSSVPSTSHLSSGLATPELDSTRASAENSDDGSGGTSRSGAGRPVRRPVEPRLGFVLRDRADSGESAGSSVSRRAGLAATAGAVQKPVAAVARDGKVGARTTGVDNLKKVETRTSRSNSAGTDGRFSSSPASSYSGPGTLSTYAPSSSTAPTSVYPVSPSAQPYTSRQMALTPLYESAHKHSHHDVTTSAQAHSRVKKVEQELLAYDPSISSSGGGTDRPTLSQQLAAYGQSLAVERKLAAMEAKTSGAGQYRFETIGTSSSKGESIPLPYSFTPTNSASSSTASSTSDSSPSRPKPTTTSVPLDHPSSSKLAVPQWRAIPSQDRLMPPPPAGRRSISPSAHNKPKEAHPHHSASPHFSPSTNPPSTTSASNLSSPPRTRASTPSSASSSTHVASPQILGANPALHPKAAVSYVEVTPPSSSHPGSSSRISHAHGGGNSKRSDRTHSAKGGSVTSAKDQLELDAIEQARIAAAVPTAVLTVPKKKGGFARRLFGKN